MDTAPSALSDRTNIPETTPISTAAKQEERTPPVSATLPQTDFAPSSTAKRAAIRSLESQLAFIKAEIPRLRGERDEAQKQVARLQASRDDLARQQGHCKGLNAKLEGALNAANRRAEAQADELHQLKAHCEELERQLAAAQARLVQLAAQARPAQLHIKLCADATPERCRAVAATLRGEAKAAAAAAEEEALRARRLEALVETESKQREELAEFAEIEHRAATDASTQLTAQLEAAQHEASDRQAALEARVAEATEQLVAARAEAADMKGIMADTARILDQKNAEMLAIREELQQAVATAGATQGAAAEAAAARKRAESNAWQAAENLRAAEAEVDLIGHQNEQMFRYVKYIKGRLAAHKELAAVPDLAHLVRELHVWCDKEAASRAAVAATPGRTPSKPLAMTAAARGTPASAIKSAIRHPTAARGLY